MALPELPQRKPVFVPGGNQPGTNGPARNNGMPSESLYTATDDSLLPSTKNPAAKRMAPAVKLMRDVVAGPEAIRKAKQAYLPQDPGESATQYDLRLNRSVFFGFVGRAIDGLTGLVFAKDPVLGDDVPPVIRGDDNGKGGLWENIDNAGTHGAVFTREIFADGLTTGHAGILVDFPRTGGVQTAADEQEAIRPYWVPIRKDDIVSWRTTIEQGRLILTQLVLKACATVPVGPFGEAEQEQYRVYTRTPDGQVLFRLLTIDDDHKTVRVLDEGQISNQTQIPFVEVRSPTRTGYLESKPPLLDMAYLNIAHYQEWSDAAYSRHKTCVPIFTTIGLDRVGDGDDSGTPPQLVLGANAGLNLPLGGDAKYVSHAGQSLASCREALEDLKTDMGHLGLAMLAPQQRGVETAEAKRLDKATTDSALATHARMVQDALEQALDFTARYLGLDDGGSVEVSRDFDNEPMDAPTMEAYIDLATKLDVPVRMVLEALQDGDRIADTVDLDELEEEMLATKAQKLALAQAMAPAPAAPAEAPEADTPTNYDIQYDATGRPTRLSRAAAAA